MNLKTLRLIIFSPTGTTKKIALRAAEGIGAEKIIISDLTRPSGRGIPITPITEDLLCIAVPVYEERIPHFIVPLLEKIQGNGKPAVFIAVYGNVGYGITLLQFKKIASRINVIPAAYGTFIGEHSFSTETNPIAEGRPDKSDLEKAHIFGERIRQKIDASVSADVITPLKVKGSLPLMARILPLNSAPRFTLAPAAVPDICNNCGACAIVCPAGAIDSVIYAIDESLCLRCFSCVKKCSTHARQIQFKAPHLTQLFLSLQTRRRKEPEVFL